MLNESSLMTLSSTGRVYFGQINIDEGGEAILENVHNLNDHIIVWDGSGRADFIEEEGSLKRTS